MSRRGRGQAPDRLRLPRADAELPGRRHADGGTDRVRIAARARPLHRRDDPDPRRDPRHRGRQARPRGQSAQERAAHRDHGGRPANGPTPIRANSPRSRCQCSSSRSTGRRSRASTTSTATRTSCAPASRWMRTRKKSKRKTQRFRRVTARPRQKRGLVVSGSTAPSPRSVKESPLHPRAPCRRPTDRPARRSASAAA